MGARDPETGQFVSSGSSMADTSYSDHEIQWIQNDLRFRDGADSGPDTSVESVSQFPVTERGLDNDEIAELVYLRADVSFGLNSVGDQTTRNFFRGRTDFGANLAGTEFLTDPDNVDTETFDVDDSGTNDFARDFRTTDEAGQWYSESLRGSIGYRDTTNNVGANDTNDRVQVVIPFRDIYGSGPYLDSTDDLTNRMGLFVRNAIDSAHMDQRIMLAWNVQTVEGGRAAFGRP